MSDFSTIYEAIQNGTLEDVKFLVEQNGEKVNTKNDKGETPLHISANLNNIEVVKYLISKGADVNAKDNRGDTPLHSATDGDPCLELIECLITNGAEIDAKGHQGFTPLQSGLVALNSGEVIKYLVSHGADIYYKNANGSSAIDFAKVTKQKHLLGVKGCYVATCVYGSYDCPEVMTLRRYRDTILANTVAGRLFIQVYYSISPKIVRLFGKQKWFIGLFKPILNRLVIRLRNRGIDNNQC